MAGGSTSIVERTSEVKTCFHFRESDDNERFNTAYSNEAGEPIHIHCEKAEKESKYWLDENSFDIIEVYGYNLSTNDRRQVRKIIYLHFDYIVEKWREYFGEAHNG